MPSSAPRLAASSGSVLPVELAPSDRRTVAVTGVAAVPSVVPGVPDGPAARSADRAPGAAGGGGAGSAGVVGGGGGAPAPPDPSVDALLASAVASIDRPIASPSAVPPS